jgi:hypothetical protein
VTYWSEVTILSLMLYILQSRFSGVHQQAAQAAQQATNANAAGYSKVPDAEPMVSADV